MAAIDLVLWKKAKQFREKRERVEWMKLADIFNESGKEVRVKHHGWPEGMSAKYLAESEKDIAVVTTKGRISVIGKDEHDGLWSPVIEKKVEKLCGWLTEDGYITLRKEAWHPPNLDEWIRVDKFDVEIERYE